MKALLKALSEYAGSGLPSRRKMSKTDGSEAGFQF
jgi:hypothetical protein